MLFRQTLVKESKAKEEFEREFAKEMNEMNEFLSELEMDEFLSELGSMSRSAESQA